MTQLRAKSEVSRFIHSKDTEGIPYVTCKIYIAHAQYDVIKMLGMETNIIFGFLIPTMQLLGSYREK